MMKNLSNFQEFNESRNENEEMTKVLKHIYIDEDEAPLEDFEQELADYDLKIVSKEIAYGGQSDEYNVTITGTKENIQSYLENQGMDEDMDDEDEDEDYD